MSGASACVERAAKLMRVYALQMDVLGRYRGRGVPRVTVERVNVNAGGQAVVGVVAAPARRARDDAGKPFGGDHPGSNLPNDFA